MVTRRFEGESHSIGNTSRSDTWRTFTSPINRPLFYSSCLKNRFSMSFITKFNVRRLEFRYTFGEKTKIQTGLTRLFQFYSL